MVGDIHSSKRKTLTDQGAKLPWIILQIWVAKDLISFWGAVKKPTKPANEKHVFHFPTAGT